MVWAMHGCHTPPDRPRPHINIIERYEEFPIIWPTPSWLHLTQTTHLPALTYPSFLPFPYNCVPCRLSTLIFFRRRLRRTYDSFNSQPFYIVKMLIPKKNRIAIFSYLFKGKCAQLLFVPVLVSFILVEGFLVSSVSVSVFHSCI